jgi:integrative and conjugative element protein (TIGR02256 family)
MARMTFNRAFSGTITISTSATETFAAFTQVGCDDPEAGGILLGRLILESDNVVVDEATVPNVEDRQSRFFFWRSNQHAQRRVVEAWDQTEGTRIYLGEWHTHPEDIPNPSCVDKKNWQRLIKKCKYEQDFLFFVIVGLEETRIWEGSKDGGIILLQPY